MTVPAHSNDPVHQSPAPGNGARTIGPVSGRGKHEVDPSVGDLVQEVTTQISTLLHSEIELAKLEVRSSVKNVGTGVAFFLTAAVLLVFSVTFGFIALAEGLVAAHIWRWLAYLIVFLFFVLVAAALVYLGVRKVKRVKGAPRTIATSKETVDYLRTNTRRG